MKSLGFHLRAWSGTGRACPCPGPGRALGRRKHGQSCAFTPSRRKLITTCCMTAPQGRVGQVAAAGLCRRGMARALQTGDSGLPQLGSRRATEPAAAIGNAARRTARPGGRNPLPDRAGPASPGYHQGKERFVGANPSTVPVAGALGINPTRNVILGRLSTRRASE